MELDDAEEAPWVHPTVGQFTLSPRRYAVLGCFCLGNLTNELYWISFSPVFDTVSHVFGVSSLGATMLPTSYLIIFGPATLFALWLHARTGLRMTILTASIGQAVGGWLRYAACASAHALLQQDGPSGTTTSLPGHFALLVAGQVLAGLAQPIYTNMPARVSAVWFAAHERDLATVAAVMANPIGNALGSILPTVMTHGPTDSGGLAHWALLQAVLATVTAMATWWQVQDKPASPPSAAAAAREEGPLSPSSTRAGEEAADSTHAGLLADSAAPGKEGRLLNTHVVTVSLWQGYKQLLGRPNFTRLLLGFGIALGLFNALLSLLAQMLAPCGYDSDVAGLAGAILLASGLVSAGVAGVVLKRTRAYVPMLQAGAVGVLASMLLFLSSLRHGAVGALYASCAVLGIVAVPLLPISLENAAECSYPLSEDVSSSLLTMAGKYIGVALTFALQPILSLPQVRSCDSVATPSAGLILACLLLGCASILCFTREYRRQRAEGEYELGSKGEESQGEW